LFVNDQGMGIDEEDREHVFGKFFRSSEASARISGTGLGLAVAREIVETHGGEIRVQSEPGSGSTFWIELPLRRTAATPALGYAPRVVRGARRPAATTRSP